MLLQQTLLISLVYAFAKLFTLFGTSQIERPIIVGPLIGLVLGDLQQGIFIGATLELAFIGAISIGAAAPPDVISGAVLGTSLAITSGGGVETAIAIGVPMSAIMMGVTIMIQMPLANIMVHIADKKAADGDIKGVERWFWLTGFVATLSIVPIVAFIFYFGQGFVEGFMASVPEWVMNGLGLATGLIPALGFAMLAQMTMNKKVAVFFFMGFFAVKFLELNTIGVAIFATIIMIVLVQQEYKMKQATVSPDSGGAIDEF